LSLALVGGENLIGLCCQKAYRISIKKSRNITYLSVVRIWVNKIFFHFKTIVLLLGQ